MRKAHTYRVLIDQLVAVCRDGQGQIGPRRALAGVWNPHADAASAPDQHANNELLARLSVADRDVVARMIARAFEGGVFETLKMLESHSVAPFEDGYEGGPCHDFVGRLAGDWDWPDDAG